jgi:4-diphosphocytidyl-2-C-methyl-D-erythritol kinase
VKLERTSFQMRLRAFAKINLGLHILGLRPDRFHEVRTILQTIELHDTLLLSVRRGPFIVRSRAQAMPQDHDNLIWTAGVALWRAIGRTGIPEGVAMTVTKRIPAAAGLGGASSDAAAALVLFRKLWAPRKGIRFLREVAASVGSDVPFFFDGGTVLATGRGERTRQLAPLECQWIVLALPEFGVKTPQAYRWWDGLSDSKRRKYLRPLSTRWRSRLDLLSNDLQGPVVEQYPAIAEMTERLRVVGARGSAMSGSGSAVFGLFATQAEAVVARRRIRKPGWRTWITRTILRSDYVRLAAPARID